MQVRADSDLLSSPFHGLLFHAATGAQETHATKPLGGAVAIAATPWGDGSRGFGPIYA